MAYYKDSGYTYLQVRNLIQTSQGRASLFYGPASPHGHASALHQSIDNGNLVNRLKMLSAASAFKDSATTNFGGSIKTEDQAFLLVEILNSKLGRAALQAMDAAAGGPIVRLKICYLVGNTSAFSLREAKLVIPPGVSKGQAKMNVAKYGVVNHNTPMQEIVAVFDSGYPELQIVTCYPASEGEAGTYGNFGGYTLDIQGGASTTTKWNP